MKVCRSFWTNRNNNEARQLILAEIDQITREKTFLGIRRAIRTSDNPPYRTRAFRPGQLVRMPFSGKNCHGTGKQRHSRFGPMGGLKFLCWEQAGFYSIPPTGLLGRLGESILLGLDPLNRPQIEGPHTNAISLVAEVIKATTKPFTLCGEIVQSAFGTPPADERDGKALLTILALGRQDIDPCGLTAAPEIMALGASGVHLILDTGKHGATVGSEITFRLNYSAFLRVMTSPFIVKTHTLLTEHGAFATWIVHTPQSSEELYQWH
jgi:hypothetical protein